MMLQKNSNGLFGQPNTHILFQQLNLKNNKKKKWENVNVALWEGGK